MASDKADTEASEPGKGTKTKPKKKQVAVEKHPLATRWMHWINFPLIFIMIWSGLRIYWADVRDPYGFGLGFLGWHWFDFLPDGINERFGLERRLAKGMAYHFTFGWLFALNGMFYVLYKLRSGEWKHLVPGPKSIINAPRVVLHDLGISKKPLPRQGRYNGAQKITYTLVIGLGALALLTGFAIYKPTQLNLLTIFFGGYESSRTIHFAVTIAFLVFFGIHILQVVRAGWANFASMITGYELLKPGVEPGTAWEHGKAKVISKVKHVDASRRGFITAGVSVVAAAAGLRLLNDRPESNGIGDVFRRGHEFNESLWRGLSREETNLAPTFDRSESSILRVNGRHGIREEVDLDAWELTVIGPDGSTLGTHTMDDIRALPKVEYTVEHKCVEGWSHIVTWGGARFSDFMALYADELGEDATEFVSMSTPDEGYYVGLDMPSMRNPQMLLAYELEGEPLDSEHGAPLRLATPNKYGIKCIKRIGTIEFTNEQPTDYWYERGYDWYAQL